MLRQCDRTIADRSLGHLKNDSRATRSTWALQSHNKHANHAYSSRIVAGTVTDLYKIIIINQWVRSEYDYWQSKAGGPTRTVKHVADKWGRDFVHRPETKCFSQPNLGRLLPLRINTHVALTKCDSHWPLEAD